MDKNTLEIKWGLFSISKKGVYKLGDIGKAKKFYSMTVEGESPNTTVLINSLSLAIQVRMAEEKESSVQLYIDMNGKKSWTPITKCKTTNRDIYDTVRDDVRDYYHLYF